MKKGTSKRGQAFRHVKEEGLTLIELIVAIALLMIVLVPGAVLLVETAKSSAGLAMKAAANSLASGDLACVEAQPLASLAKDANECVGSKEYVPAVVGEFRMEQVMGRGKIGFLVLQATQWTDVSKGTNNFKCLEVRVKVYWPFVNKVEMNSISSTNNVDILDSWIKAHPNSGKISRAYTGRCEYVPQIQFEPASLSFDNWSNGQYLDASPGNHSPVETLTVTVAPPRIPTEQYDWVDIGNISIVGGEGDFGIVSNDCSGEAIYSTVTVVNITVKQPKPTSCTVEIDFSPPTSATPGPPDVSGDLELNDNASGSPQIVPLSGYVSPDLFVVK